MLIVTRQLRTRGEKDRVFRKYILPTAHGLCVTGITKTHALATIDALVIQAMLPDTLQHESERSEVPQEGVLAGIFTTIERGVSAISVAITGAIMAIGGYAAGQATQSESAIMSLYICVGLMPGLGMIGAVLALRGYSLKD